MLELLSYFLVVAIEKTLKYKLFCVSGVEVIQKLVLVKKAAHPKTESVFNNEFIFKGESAFISS